MTYTPNPLEFTTDCTRCGLALIYPTTTGRCIWCTGRGRRPLCWRFTADAWMLYRIKQASWTSDRVAAMTAEAQLEGIVREEA